MLGRSVDAAEYGRLETFPVAQHSVAVVEFAGDELAALCPIDVVQPDFYRFTIRYVPGDVALESKSLKLYLHTFRDERIFAEHLAPRMAADLAAALGVAVFVRLRQNRRGGIDTCVEAFGGTPDATQCQLLQQTVVD